VNERLSEKKGKQQLSRRLLQELTEREKRVVVVQAQERREISKGKQSHMASGMLARGGCRVWAHWVGGTPLWYGARAGERIACRLR